MQMRPQEPLAHSDGHDGSRTAEFLDRAQPWHIQQLEQPGIRLLVGHHAQQVPSARGSHLSIAEEAHRLAAVAPSTDDNDRHRAWFGHSDHRTESEGIPDAASSVNTFSISTRPLAAIASGRPRKS